MHSSAVKADGRSPECIVPFIQYCHQGRDAQGQDQGPEFQGLKHKFRKSQ